MRILYRPYWTDIFFQKRGAASMTDRAELDCLGKTPEIKDMLTIGRSLVQTIGSVQKRNRPGSSSQKVHMFDERYRSLRISSSVAARTIKKVRTVADMIRFGERSRC